MARIFIESKQSIYYSYYRVLGHILTTNPIRKTVKSSDIDTC